MKGGEGLHRFEVNFVRDKFENFMIPVHRIFIKRCRWNDEIASQMLVETRETRSRQTEKVVRYRVG